MNIDKPITVRSLIGTSLMVLGSYYMCIGIKGLMDIHQENKKKSEEEA